MQNCSWINFNHLVVVVQLIPMTVLTLCSVKNYCSSDFRTVWTTTAKWLKLIQEQSACRSEHWFNNNNNNNNNTATENQIFGESFIQSAQQSKCVNATNYNIALMPLTPRQVSGKKYKRCRASCEQIASEFKTNSVVWLSRVFSSYAFGWRESNAKFSKTLHDVQTVANVHAFQSGKII